MCSVVAMDLVGRIFTRMHVHMRRPTAPPNLHKLSLLCLLDN